MPEDKTAKVIKSDAEWREQLSPEEYRITREHGTEHPFTSPYLHNKEHGIYKCVACGKPLFSSETKYDSGSGWPSFYQPLKPGAVTEHVDRSHFMTRTEIRCTGCEAHLGHVFEDGPDPTGLRYCMNGIALDFEKE